VILYPTGGCVGLIGMCKAFDEMQEMGWIGAERPRMVAVQAEGCCAHRTGVGGAPEFGRSSSRNAATSHPGLRVPGPLGDFLILSMLRQTKGAALTVTDEEMLDAGKELASLEGIFAAPEGAATVSATRKLAASGWIKPEETVVLFNTGTGTNTPKPGNGRCSPGQGRSAVATRRLYYDDAFLKEFTARVMHCEVFASGSERGDHGNGLGTHSGSHGVLSHVRRAAQRFGKIGDATCSTFAMKARQSYTLSIASRRIRR